VSIQIQSFRFLALLRISLSIRNHAVFLAVKNAEGWVLLKGLGSQTVNVGADLALVNQSLLELISSLEEREAVVLLGFVIDDFLKQAFREGVTVRFERSALLLERVRVESA